MTEELNKTDLWRIENFFKFSEKAQLHIDALCKKFRTSEEEIDFHTREEAKVFFTRKLQERKRKTVKEVEKAYIRCENCHRFHNRVGKRLCEECERKMVR